MSFILSYFTVIFFFICPDLYLTLLPFVIYMFCFLNFFYYFLPAHFFPSRYFLPLSTFPVFSSILLILFYFLFCLFLYLCHFLSYLFLCLLIYCFLLCSFLSFPLSHLAIICLFYCVPFNRFFLCSFLNCSSRCHVLPLCSAASFLLTSGFILLCLRRRTQFPRGFKSMYLISCARYKLHIAAQTRRGAPAN